ncbi:hypothetical protein HYR99_28275 [Candidatus Poribacteria bacterium]|nr:hypothetical protein [Candidatus Poribacteria bacterium]
MRVLSARAAEKVVTAFYQHYGRRVEDVSIHQVTSDENSDWESYDLKIDGIPVDVKNSRRSRQSPNTYVEHCVPRFKQNRKKQDVTIAGVLSQYLWVSGILDPENISGGRDTSVIFLGVTTDQRLDQIQNEFKDDLLHIHWERHNRRGHFLPAWMFDYPDFVYQQRDDAIRQLAQQTIPERRLWDEFNRVPPIPLFIAAGMDISEIRQLETFTDWEGSFLSDILNRQTQYGLSLPFLFLGILKHFLQMVSHSSDDNYRPDRYRRLIFSPEQDPDHKMPLGIYDPLKTIDSLITALETLWEAEHGPIRSYRVFQLQGPNILRGQEKDQVHWKTLIAYCGGEKCDKNPLVLGECDHCLKCGKLICPECDFCSEMCSLSQTRRPTPFNPSGDRRSHEQMERQVPQSSQQFDDIDDIPF